MLQNCNNYEDAANAPAWLLTWALKPHLTHSATNMPGTCTTQKHFTPLNLPPRQWEVSQDGRGSCLRSVLSGSVVSAGLFLLKDTERGPLMLLCEPSNGGAVLPVMVQWWKTISCVCQLWHYGRMSSFLMQGIWGFRLVVTSLLKMNSLTFLPHWWTGHFVSKQYKC